MKEIVRWVNCCVTLHNMLAQLGDSWEDLSNRQADDTDSDSSSDSSDLTSDLEADCGRRDRQGHRQLRPTPQQLFRKKIKSQCLKFHYAAGTFAA
ncbi:hypothetical protein PGTUg99_010608 [Puccinia graminis f. sp. tritici]|nr:hypothetical protein PGTUg99_010608 [Puccinia graminis f. sp. tritici]